jgi:hypothetical protein
MKRFYGLAVVLILGIVGVFSFLKRPSSSAKISQSLDQASQHNSSTEDFPARKTAPDSGESTPSQNSRSMNQSAPAQAGAATIQQPPAQQMAVRGPHTFVKHEVSPIKRNIQDSELKNSNVVGGDWKLVTSLYAVPQALLSAMDDTPSVGEQNGFTFFEADNANLQETLFSSERPLVVYDSRLQTFGVVTGTIQIDLRKGTNVSGILQDYGAKIEHSFPGTGTYYISMQEQPFNLVQLKNSLETDSRINRVEVEIVSRRYGKQ